MNSHTTEPPTPLSVKEALGGDDYIIPMYQRNYAWEEGEIRQLIRDVVDSMPAGRPYHVGSLVVYERDLRDGGKVYETIDGQQRLTTLNLLACYLRNWAIENKPESSTEAHRETNTDQNNTEKTKTTENKTDPARLAALMAWYDRPRLRFESREHSRRTLQAIFQGVFEKAEPESLRGVTINQAILTGYRLIQQCLHVELESDGVSLDQFAHYLWHRVCLMRVRLPEDTDLNHYFEIMNNRGEQLEKHEVLKSQLMKALDDHSPEPEREANRQCIHAVWEACADMERYAQMGLTPEQRHAVFGHQDWTHFLPADFDALRSALGFGASSAASPAPGLSLRDIISGSAPRVASATTGPASERFNTVVNFPNFLLHILRVVTGENVPLDDKQLLPVFKHHIFESENPAHAVKQFIHGLLHGKYLFDRYVLKREFLAGKDHWSLKMCKWRSADSGEGSASYVNSFDENETDDRLHRRILMLLSAFHVSTPTMAYKYWLNAALNYLFHAEEITALGYRDYLESVATAFVFDRYLKGDDYYVIIHTRKGACATRRADVTLDALSQRLTFPKVENFVFNYLDYLLWLKHSEHNPRFREWEFTFRSSVEHLYPQSPMEGLPGLPDAILHSFGNLCLISHSKNSRLSNFTPKAKQELYPPGEFDSIKQRLMLNQPTWDATAIRDHQHQMLTCLLQPLEDQH